MNAVPRRSWDIFCRVVDNLGDAGICWRLARQLAHEYGLTVRLYCDRPDVLADFVPALDSSRELQQCQGVEVCLWPQTDACCEPADVVIEALACELPPAYVAAMAARAAAPVWINLEYLSAEPWIADCHLQPSPHPRLPLLKHFFFPGFSDGTGGLMRERDLSRQRAALVADPVAAWSTVGAEPPAANAFNVSLFCYENPALPDLISAWQSGGTPIRCFVRPGRSLAQLAAIIGKPGFAPGDSWHAGSLSLFALPFCPQEQFDHLLWICDLNLVRGEDSFVRAQWAARPFLWHIYPQQDGAHLRKLEAFLDLYSIGLPGAVAIARRQFWLAWNQGDSVEWQDFWRHRAVLGDHAAKWAEQLAERDDLAKNLVSFVESRLK